MANQKSKFWNQVLDNMAMEDEKPIMQRNYSGAISEAAKQVEASRLEFQEEIGGDPNQIKDMSDVISRVRSVQEKLTPALLEKYPEAAKLYDAAKGQYILERTKTFQDLKDSYQLSHKEASDIVGEDAMLQFYKDMGVVSENINREWPGAASVTGVSEKEGEYPLYGLRSALLTQYSGEPKTAEDLVNIKKEYEEAFGVKKGAVESQKP
jgi:hypothetical protein